MPILSIKFQLNPTISSREDVKIIKMAAMAAILDIESTQFV